MSDLEIKLKELENSYYQKSLIEPFLQEYKLENLLSLYLLENNKKSTIRPLLQNLFYFLSEEKIYSKELFLNNSKSIRELLEKLLISEEMETRLIITKGIVTNYEEFNQIMIYLSENNELEFKNNLNIIFYQFNDQETEISFQIFKILDKINDICIKNKHKIWYLVDEYIYAGIKHKNIVVALRYMDLIINLALKKEEIFLILKEKNYLEEVLKLYCTSDLLAKLNAVEILSKLGSSKWTSDFFKENQLFTLIIKDAFGDSEFYIRKYCILLLAKMYVFGSIKFDLKLLKNFLIFIENCILMNSTEEIESALEIIGLMAFKQEGLELLISNKVLFKEYLKLFKSTKEVIKKKFINSFSEFFNNSETKSANILKHIFSLLNDCSLIDKINFQKEFINEELLMQSMNSIFLHLIGPFVDLEIESIKLIKNIIKFEFGIREFIKNKNSIDYLIKNNAKNKEIFDEKEEILENLMFYLKKCQNKDLVVKEFESKLLTILPGRRKDQSMVYYKTEADD